MWGRLAVMRWLIEDAGACPDTANWSGNTPLWLACYHNLLNVAKYLVTHGTNPRTPNIYGQTPFWCACSCGYLKVARWLAITVGVSGDVTRESVDEDFSGNAPLAVAKMRGGSAIVAWLTSFLQRRVLIAYWSTGRGRDRAGLPDLGCTSESTVWHRLPREAMAEVLLLLTSP